MADKRETFSRVFRLINVHPVNGEIVGVDFLRNADHNFVEGLFYFARRYGRAEFEYHGKTFELVKNPDLTYTVFRPRSDEEVLADAFA